MALNPLNVQVGAHRFIWDEGGGSEIDLGLTFEGSVLRVEKGGEEQLSEQWGIAPYDFVFAGEKVTFRGMFREWGSLADNTILETLLPFSTSSAGPTVKEWRFGSVAGQSARSIAKSLIMRPERNVGATPPADVDEDKEIYLAVPLMLAEVLLDNGARSGVWACSFLGLVDTTKSSGNLLGRWKTNRA
jgi:hypothetical protein